MKENKKLVDQQIKFVKELHENCSQSEVTKDKQIPTFKWTKIESTDYLWLNYLQLEILNIINEQYLENQTIDKKRVESWLQNKIRLENSSGVLVSQKNSGHTFLKQGNLNVALQNQLSTMQNTIHNPLNNRYKKNCKYLNDRHKDQDLMLDDVNTQDKYEVYVRLYTEKLWRSMNKYLIAQWRPQDKNKQKQGQKEMDQYRGTNFVKKIVPLELIDPKNI